MASAKSEFYPNVLLCRMASFVSILGLCLWLYVASRSSRNLFPESVNGTVHIDGAAATGRVDEDFICATIDWWPPEKCDYGTCSWGNASLLNLDISNKIFYNAITAFSPLKIRLGGTLQDKVIYQTQEDPKPCPEFAKNDSEMFGFTQGCLTLSRWDELNIFFKQAGANVIFGLNALNGKTITSGGQAVGAWDPSNAESLLRYTINNDYTIAGWELGNELSGHGIGVSITADQYASDVYTLRQVVEDVYKGSRIKPLIIAPGELFFDGDWLSTFINKSFDHLQVISHHIYNLGPGNDEHLVEKILDPEYLQRASHTFSNIKSLLKSSGAPVVAWVGEAGGVSNSGRHLVTNAFVASFWYLDQLGMAASFDTKTYCRQSLIGGNYGLLNTTTFVPNPDYYSALLWHRLMGRNVLSTRFVGTNKLRAYAHCSKNSPGITLLLLNLGSNVAVQVSPSIENAVSSQTSTIKVTHLPWRINLMTSISGTHTIGPSLREEYHLTAKDDNYHSQTMLLNGKILTVDDFGTIPPFKPIMVNTSEPISVAPLSIVFAQMPTIQVPACR